MPLPFPQLSRPSSSISAFQIVFLLLMFTRSMFCSVRARILLRYRSVCTRLYGYPLQHISYLLVFVPFDNKESIGIRRIVANWARYESTCRGVRLLDRLRTEDRKSCNSRGWWWRYDHLPEVAIYRWFGIIDNWPPRYPVSPGNSGSVDVAVTQSICAQRP